MFLFGFEKRWNWPFGMFNSHLCHVSRYIRNIFQAVTQSLESRGPAFVFWLSIMQKALGSPPPWDTSSQYRVCRNWPQNKVVSDFWVLRHSSQGQKPAKVQVQNLAVCRVQQVVSSKCAAVPASHLVARHNVCSSPQPCGGQSRPHSFLPKNKSS